MKNKSLLQTMIYFSSKAVTIVVSGRGESLFIEIYNDKVIFLFYIRYPDVGIFLPFTVKYN